MNKMVPIALLGAVILSAGARPAVAQERGRRNSSTGAIERNLRNSPFKLVLSQLPSSGTDSATVHIYSRIPLNRLVFINQNGSFEANYEVSIFIVDDDDKVSGTKIWTETVVKGTFAETRAVGESHNAHTTINLPAGKYHVVSHMTDLDSRQRISSRTELEVG